jgi:YfiH family protein
MQNTFFQATSTIGDGNMSFLYDSHADVLANRKHFFAQNNLKIEQAIAMKADHGTTIEIVDHTLANRGMTNQESGIAADALITQDRTVILFLLTADCLPVIFFDPFHNAICLAHISRANTTRHFVKKIIDAFVVTFSSQPNQMVVSVGPAIHQYSYVKNKQVLEGLTKGELTAWQPFLESHDNDQVAIDVIGYTVSQLVNQGITANNISVSDIDTYSSTNYFSHVRSLMTKEPAGRFATMCALR